MINKPLAVVYELTLKCNLHCLHCGSNAGIKREKELTLKESYELINDLKDLGTKHLFLSGGEALLHEHWLEIGLYAKSLGLKVGLITNGYKVSDETINKLLELQPCVVGVSLDGPPSIHDQIRVKGSFNEAVKFIKQLKKNSLEVTVITTVNKLNINSLDSLLAWNLFLGVDSWQIQVANLGGRMKPELMINNDEYKSLTNYLMNAREKFSQLNIQGAHCTGLGGKLMVTDYPWTGCTAGINSLGVMANGDVIGCLSIMNHSYIEGNIRDQSIKDLWFNPESFSYNRQPQQLTGNCAGCTEINCRGGCKAVNINQGLISESPYCIRF